MLARAGFGDDSLFAHARGEQTLAERVVDFVRAGVQQVFALEVDARAGEDFGQVRCELQRGGPAGEIAEQIVEFFLEALISAGFGIGALELFERRDQRFRDVAPAECAVASARVRDRLSGCAHRFFLRATRTACMKLAISAGSFLPGFSSTPLQTSTA